MSNKVIQRSLDITPHHTPVEKTYDYIYGIHTWTIRDFMKGWETENNEETHLKSKLSVITADKKKLEYEIIMSAYPVEWPTIVDEMQITFTTTRFTSATIPTERLRTRMAVNATLKKTPPAHFPPKDFERTGSMFDDGDGEKLIADVLSEDGSLTIHFNFVIRVVIDVKHQQDFNTINIERSQLENLSDFTLICDEKSFKVHKVVLANTSSFFKAMFSNNDCIENQNNELEIKDLKAGCVETIVDVMYKGKLQTILTQRNLEILLEVSDYYGMEYLRNECVSQIIHNFLNSENILHLLGIGLRFNANRLIQVARQLVMKDIANLCQTKEFSDFMKEFPNALLKKEAEEDLENNAKKKRTTV